jgi:dienelactone hydrolase
MHTAGVICAAAGVLAFAAAAMPARAALRTETIEYKAGDLACRGYLAWDDAVSGRRPGVLVVHEYWGLNDYARSRADQLAQLGYVAFAADMYGNGKVAKDRQEAAALANAVRSDRPLLRSRIRAALDLLRARPECDPARVAAIGFCFGGTTALELARSGADVTGVVSFHGGIATPMPAGPGAIKAHVLVLSGADDRGVTPDDIAAFKKEMDGAAADWQMVQYGHAVHGFSNPAGGNDPSSGYAYNREAATRSWQAMQDFFDEIFGQGK